MANDFGSNPILLDTFTSAIDVGSSKFGDSNAGIKVISIEWITPTTADHTALITDGGGKTIFSETCVTAKQSIIKYFYGRWVRGIKIGVSGVSSGKIAIEHY